MPSFSFQKLVVRFGSLLGRSSGEDQVVYSDEEYDDDDTKVIFKSFLKSERSIVIFIVPSIL